ncbi:MAG TPA: hypothetical protein VIK15_03675 [Candidatus Anoxymicrobiaceae bacterium]
MSEQTDDTGSVCESAGRAIEEMGDGPMGRVRWMLLRRHVKDCPDCGTRLYRMSAVVDALSEMQRAQAPEEFASLVMARLVEALAGRPAGTMERGRDNRNLFLVAGAAGLGLAIGLTLAVVRHLLGRHGSEELAMAGHA